MLKYLGGWTVLGESGGAFPVGYIVAVVFCWSVLDVVVLVICDVLTVGESVFCVFVVLVLFDVLAFCVPTELVFVVLLRVSSPVVIVVVVCV